MIGSPPKTYPLYQIFDAHVAVIEGSIANFLP